MGSQAEKIVVSLIILILPAVLVYPLPWNGMQMPKEEPISSIVPENYEIRIAMADLFTAPSFQLEKVKERVFVQRASLQRVKVKTERTNLATYIVFSNEENGQFPLYGAGSWIIKRDGRTGALLQAKIFYRTDPGCYMRLHPEGDKTVLELYLFDTLIHRAIPIGIPLQILLIEPFQTILDHTQDWVDWDTLLSRMPAQYYDPIVCMVERIRKDLPLLPDAEDGAMDKNGKLVFIKSAKSQERLPGFNCSGFAKWVADGLYKPRTGSYLDIEDLKKKQLSIRGNRITNRYEEERDPFFGLDWTRNIAQILSGSSDPEGQDVRNLPYGRYREDIGFPMDELKGILFYLAVREPGTFYLGSINREYGNEPILRQHYHIVVLFPYFLETGEFRVVVFERNVESDLASLNKRYPGDFIHLVRIEADTIFNPPRIE